MNDTRSVEIGEWLRERRERTWTFRATIWGGGRVPDRRPRHPADREAFMRFVVESARRKIARAYEFLGPRHVRLHLDKL